ncbi:hypothetical protein BJV82DRAFT_519023, partial [Fennellomyces sp. T-0311]
CKRRRRKCVWDGDSTVCVRCARISLDCVPALQDFSSDEDDPPHDLIPTALQHWHCQVELLENELRRVERDLDYYRDIQRQQQSMEWKLSIEDGLLKLHTAITSYEELIMFSQASLRYLSPFKGLVKVSPFQFESTAADTIVYTFTRMFSRAVNQHPCKSQALPPRPMPVGNPEMRAIMDNLVQMHFQYSNPKLPLLHAPTYFKHYHSLADPLSCPVTLAICVSTICNTHSIINCSTTEQRELGDYFYTKCKAILLDMFDDPTRKLETIFTINQLLHFVMLVLLQPSETRRLVTISYLLCKDLESVFASGYESPVLSILFQRNFLYTESFINLLDVVIDKNPLPTPSPPLLFVEPIPDEDETTRLHIDLYNHLLRLSNHPYVTGVASFVVCPVNNVSLEAIIQGDTAIREWWDSLPADLRICDDLYGEEAYTGLKQKNSMISAVLFAFAHSNIIRIHTCLIVPKLSSGEVSQIENKDILRILSERAVTKVLRSCELLLNTLIEMILLPSEALAPCNVYRICTHGFTDVLLLY